MSARWEYLFVAWQSPNPAAGGVGDTQAGEPGYWITRPYTDAEKAPGDVKLSQLLNDLGAEGWELISHTIPKSVVLSKWLGWPNVGGPIEMTWTFKRPQLDQ
jgi:hypothetical protein